MRNVDILLHGCNNCEDSSHIIRMRECERESLFETHLNLIKFARAGIESVSVVQRLRMGARDILKDYVTKVRTLIHVFLPNGTMLVLVCY